MIESPFYLPQFDNQKKEISKSGLFLKGNGVYLTMNDLFEKSSLDLVRSADYNLYIEHSIDTSAKELIYYTPYYNFVEGITNTINAYSKSCSGSYTIINNTKSKTTTGRFKNYTGSIFFLSPDNIVKFGDITMQAIDDGNFTMDLIDEDYNYTKEQQKTATVRLQDGSVVSMNADIVKVYQNLYEELGDLSDWLEIKKMLYLTYDEKPFTSKYFEQIEDTRWYPNLSSLSADDITDKIRNINLNTKHFVISNLLDSSGTISDENLIKITALKATMEFNKEFGNYFKNGSEDAYPIRIEGYLGNNDFYSKSMYIPMTEMFRGNSQQLSYYISNESGYLAMLMITIERAAFSIRTVLRYIGYIITLLGLVGLYIFYLFKNKLGGRVAGRITLFSFIISQFSMLECLSYKISYLAVNHGFNLSGVMILNFILSTLLTLGMFIVLKIMLSNLSSLKIALGSIRAIRKSERNYYNESYEQSVDYNNYNKPQVSEEYFYNEQYENTYEKPFLLNKVNENVILPYDNIADIPEGYYKYKDENDNYYISDIDTNKIILSGGKSAFRINDSNFKSNSDFYI